MNYWRMAMRVGSQGPEMWPDCRSRGIAAIGYYDSEGEPIVGDCSKLTPDEYEAAWRDKDPRNSTGRSSLRNLAYHMNPGDVIYVKQGNEIVGQGTITSAYEHDLDIMIGAHYWEHFVRVQWLDDFKPVRVLLGAEQTTVLLLSPERVEKVQRAIALEKQVSDDLGAYNSEETFLEKGSKKLVYANRYERNPKLRAAAIQCHGTTCAVCGFDFELAYGARGAGYIEVHHMEPMSELTKETDVSPDKGMVCLCANCHRMIHRRQDEVLTPDELRNLMHAARG